MFAGYIMTSIRFNPDFVGEIPMETPIQQGNPAMSRPS